MTITALRRSASGLLAVLAVCVVTAAPASGQAPKAEPKADGRPEAAADAKPQTKIDTSKFIIFIHAGPKKKDDRTVRLISGALYGKGYVVRAPDDDQDEIGGPGVDYFDDSARDPALDVAAIVNETFAKLDVDRDPKQKLSPRRQTKTKNPSNWLGVWLF